MDSESVAGTVLTFSPTVMTQPIAVATIGDGMYGNSRRFIVRIDKESSNAALGTALSDGLVTITNADPAPVFSISAASSVNEGSAITVTVTKTNATALTHAVTYATSYGSADASDFTATSGTLSFGPTVMSQTFQVQTTDDSVYESTEGFTVALSAPTAGATLSPTASSDSISISNLDAAPAFSINSPASKIEGEIIVFTVTRTGDSVLSHNVSYATSNGTAV